MDAKKILSVQRNFQQNEQCWLQIIVHSHNKEKHHGTGTKTNMQLRK
jgi:hypothetical protein